MVFDSVDPFFDYRSERVHRVLLPSDAMGNDLHAEDKAQRYSLRGRQSLH